MQQHCSSQHTHATLELTHQRISTAYLAKQMGTREAMINKHYSHFLARMGAKELAGIDHGVYEALDEEA